jgi:hypothetical protein
MTCAGARAFSGGWKEGGGGAAPAPLLLIPPTPTTPPPTPFPRDCGRCTPCLAGNVWRGRVLRGPQVSLTLPCKCTKSPRIFSHWGALLLTDQSLVRRMDMQWSLHRVASYLMSYLPEARAHPPPPPPASVRRRHAQPCSRPRPPPPCSRRLCVCAQRLHLRCCDPWAECSYRFVLFTAPPAPAPPGPADSARVPPPRFPEGAVGGRHGVQPRRIPHVARGPGLYLRGRRLPFLVASAASFVGQPALFAASAISLRGGRVASMSSAVAAQSLSAFSFVALAVCLCVCMRHRWPRRRAMRCLRWSFHPCTWWMCTARALTAPRPQTWPLRPSRCPRPPWRRCP